MDQTSAFMLREQEVASRLRVSVSTLRRMRHRGTGPAWVRLGKQIRYPIGGAGGLEDWLERNLRRLEPRQGARHAGE